MAQAVRDNKGRIVAGTLNPGGRPKLPAEIRDLAQLASPRDVSAELYIQQKQGIPR